MYSNKTNFRCFDNPIFIKDNKIHSHETLLSDADNASTTSVYG